VKHENIICILARNPLPEMVGGKLECCLSRKQAAILARAFILDALSSALRVPRCDVHLGYSPPEATADFEDLIFLFKGEETDKKVSARAAEVTLVPQIDSDPGGRILDLAGRLFGSGAKKVLFACSDCPLIDPVIMKASFALLKEHKVVIGPTFNGGFYLLGMSEDNSRLFDGIEWNSDGPYRQIADRLNRENIDWQELELSYDVDRPEDLEQLYLDIDNLRLAGKDDIAFHTEKCLANFKNYH